MVLPEKIAKWQRARATAKRRRAGRTGTASIARAATDAALRQLEAARRQEQQANLSLRVGATHVEQQVGARIFALRAELEVVQMQARLQDSRNGLEDVLHTPLSGPELALAKSMSSIASGAGS